LYKNPYIIDEAEEEDGSEEDGDGNRQPV